MGFQRDCVPLAESRGGASGRCSQFFKNSEIIRRRSARVNSENNPVNCFRKRDALQERASFNGQIISAPTNINFDLS